MRKLFSQFTITINYDSHTMSILSWNFIIVCMLLVSVVSEDMDVIMSQQAFPCIYMYVMKEDWTL
jgi:hypothetical protein